MRETSVTERVDVIDVVDSIALKHVFAPCPVCRRGTVSLDSYKMEWYCESCESRWNLYKTMIKKGKIIRLKLVTQGLAGD